jgi:hypothetical protein
MARLTDEELNNDVAGWLCGKTIRAARYMTEEEQKQFYWNSRAVVIEFTDGTIMIPQADDEGNDAGALWMLENKGGSRKEILIGTL